MIISITLLILGFALLIKGADYFVLGSSAFARKYKVSELTIGLTIVAFGTSAPELIVNVVSSLKGLNDVTFGNIIGSNLFNLLFILGITAAIFPVKISHSTIFKEIPYSIVAAVVLLILANDHLFTDKRPNEVGFVDALILIFFFSLFLVYIFRNMKNDDQQVSVNFKPLQNWKITFYMLGGLAALIFGGRLAVNNAVAIANAFGISERIIGLTIIAAGTSLPELATSAVAAYRKNSDIAIGNVVGSNIFNIFFILAVSAFIHPIPYTLSFNFDTTVLIGGTMLLLFFAYSGKKATIDRWEGIVFIGFYIIYTVYLIIT